MTGGTTKTDASGEPAWLAADSAVVQLRAWGTDRVYPLPAADDPRAEWTIGAAADCWLVLEDPQHRVSRHHATLARDPIDGGWAIHDRRSKNGIRQDGERRPAFPLAPGTEIGIGGISLVAEGPRHVALRGFVARLIGWAPEVGGDVDRAVRAIRSSTARREALLLNGAGDLVAIAHQLHRYALGPDHPFVLCDPRRRAAPATVRSAANRADGIAALRSAAGGTLCVLSERLPRDFRAVLAELRAPDAQTQLVACGPPDGDLLPLLSPAIELPPLASRPDDIDRVIVEYASDAQVDLEARLDSFHAVDREWVRANEAASLADIDKAVRRIVALRAHGNLHRAAAALGMSHVSLAEWVNRRSLPLDLR